MAVLYALTMKRDFAEDWTENQERLGNAFFFTQNLRTARAMQRMIEDKDQVEFVDIIEIPLNLELLDDPPGNRLLEGRRGVGVGAIRVVE